MSLIKSKNNSFRIILTYYICIFILSFYSIYKDGYLLYSKDLIKFMGIFKPLLLVIITIIVTYLIDYLFNGKKYKFVELIKIDYNPIFNSLILLMLPINIKIIYYLIILIIFNILINIFKIKKINIYIIYKFIFILLLILLNNYTYQNVYETNIDTSLSYLDMFFGRSIGGIGTINHFLIIITFFILLSIKSYKKEITISSFITYGICIIISLFFKFNLYQNINIILNGSLLFGIVFIATIPYYSPIMFKDKIIYGILIGVFSFIFNYLINSYEGVLVAILIANIIMIIKEKVIKHVSK